MLRLITKHADEWNVDISARARGKLIEFEVRMFEEYLQEEGRDTDEVERSWIAHVLVIEDEEEIAEYEERIFPLPWGEESDMDAQLEDVQGAREKGGFLIGTPAR